MLTLPTSRCLAALRHEAAVGELVMASEAGGCWREGGQAAALGAAAGLRARLTIANRFLRWGRSAGPGCSGVTALGLSEACFPAATGCRSVVTSRR